MLKYSTFLNLYTNRCSRAFAVSGSHSNPSSPFHITPTEEGRQCVVTEHGIHRSLRKIHFRGMKVSNPRIFVVALSRKKEGILHYFPTPPCTLNYYQKNNKRLLLLTFRINES